MTALLALEDGRVFRGEAFGASGTVTGEICFNTSLSGYQEVLTDPSYFGQIVAMTNPHIGNYGVNVLDEEAHGPQVRGFVIEELSEVPSNWRSEESLEAYLKRAGVPGIQEVDTRALTKHLRQAGAMKACLTTEPLSEAEAVQRAVKGDGVVGMDFVREVTPKAPYDWDPTDAESRPWKLPSHTGRESELRDAVGNAFGFLPPAEYRVVAYDFGMKRNILRDLRQRGLSVRVVPADTSAQDVLSMGPDGVFLSNGPGDPAALDYIHKNVRSLLGKIPIFGICLGHQILGAALGGKTFKLKFGHRGGNQPVKDLTTGKVSITSQNHGFAVDAESLPPDAEVTHINLNDGTVEGLRSKSMPVFSVQYHPEAAPGPHDAAYFFDQFANLIAETKAGR
ncbi:MAG: glutamine-hydrolyzing carbamoyl-phosphate synthase small subunit [Chthoniobacterales bacterium]|jgi:carbamoyl-phosphate synthase small subunit|nr:glutamine-hydrolyzing carbamoyl-phosphate synthase small subunit [Chthoniobacterales bacterium]